MEKYLVIICTVIAFSMADIKHVNVIEIQESDIKEWNKNVTIISETPPYVDRWFQILPDTSLELSLSVVHENFTCRTQQYFVDIPFLIREYDKKTFYIPKVTDKMSDVWVCFVQTPYKSDFFFTLKIYVNYAKPAHQLLINRYRPEAIKRGKMFTSEYVYHAGDKLAVECIGLFDKCTVQITDSLLGVVDDGGRGNNVFGRGYKVTLLEADNGREISCTSNCSGLVTTEKLKFQLQKESENVMSIQFNDKTLRRKNTQSGKQYYYERIYVLNYAKTAYAVSTNMCDVELQFSFDNCIFTDGPTTAANKRMLKGSIKLNIQSVLRFRATSKEDNRVLEEVIILFHPTKTRDSSLITLTPKLEFNKNTIREYYEFTFQERKEFIHYTYEYDIGEEFAINCTKQSYASPDSHLNVNTTELDKSESDSYTNVILDESYNNTVFTCKLLDNHEKIKGEIWILFLIADRFPTYFFHYECHDSSMSRGLLLGILIGAVVGSVPFAFLCKLKARYNCKRKVENIKLKRKYAQNSTQHGNENVAMKPVHQLVEDPIYHTPNITPASVQTQELLQELPEYDYACHPPVVRIPKTNEAGSTYTDMTHNQYVPCHL